MSLSTHVLDGVRGRPAADVLIRLDFALPDADSERDRGTDGWLELADESTDADGRVRFADDLTRTPGAYRLVFATGAYFAEQDVATFYPEVAIVFTVIEPTAHHHVPLLLSPFAYSTYRGS